MKFDTEVTLDASTLKDLRRQKLHVQCTEFAEKRVSLIAENIAKFKLYSAVDGVYCARRFISHDGEQEHSLGFAWQNIWDIDEETGEVLLIIDRNESLDDTFFLGEITMYTDYYDRQFDVEIPYRWIDPQLSDEELTNLMRSAAVEQLPRIREFLVKRQQNLLNSAEGDRCRLEEKLERKTHEIDELRAKVQALTKSFTMQDFLDM